MSNVHPIPQPASFLDDLSTQYAIVKSNLDKAKKAFAKVESQIIDHCGHKEEGAQSFNTEIFKITTTGKMTRTIDQSKLDELRANIPQALFNRLFTYKPTLVLREYKYIQKNEPDSFQEVSKVITAKPAKTALKVEAVK